MGITPVSQIPLPARGGPMNPLANDTESQVPEPPPAKKQSRRAAAGRGGGDRPQDPQQEEAAFALRRRDGTIKAAAE